MLVLHAAACSQPTSPSRAPLANTFGTPEALAGAVLHALAARDRAHLESLALSEEEFREHVWPELPVSRPERNVPIEYAWGQMKQQSDASLGSALQRYGGRTLRFVRIAFVGETTQYTSFVVMRESEIVATDESGRDLVLQLFGSVMQKDGRYKLFSFVVD